jgi:hypothetical protein
MTRVHFFLIALILLVSAALGCLGDDHLVWGTLDDSIIWGN